MEAVIDAKETWIKAVELFAEAVELSSSLAIEGTAHPQESVNKGAEVFVLRNHDIAEGIEGAYVEMSVSEICDKVKNVEDAQQAIKAILNERASIVLNGITRIVGYYSRVNNWNKSKIGELRDRSKGQYGRSGFSGKHDDERQGAINRLNQ